MVREEDVLAQLDKILTSSVFANSARSKQFLEYCVNRSLSGERSQLKETTIAVEVFLREASYDPKNDPIVRVHARRVREKLGIYYRTAGQRDPITIELPKGTYVTQFLSTGIAEEKSLSTTQTNSPPSSLGGLTAEKESTSSHRMRIIHVLAWITSILLISIAVVIWARRGRVSPPARLTSLKPITILPPNATDAAWSSDGKTVAFVQTDIKEHRPLVFTLSLSGQPPQRLSHGGSVEYRPVWSPDNRQIALIRMLDDTHFAIVRYDLASRSEWVSRPFVTYFPLNVDHPTLDWSPDSRYLLTGEEVAPNTPMRLVLMRVSDGERTYLTSPPSGSSGDIEAKFSPDGRSVAFRRGGLGDLYISGMDGKARRLTFDNRGVRGIAFADGGNSILFGTDPSANEMFSIYKIPSTGGTATPITPEGFAAMDPALVREGVFSLRHVEMETQIVEVAKNEAVESQVLPTTSIDEAAVYSPDGNTIAFISTRSGSEELWLQHRGETIPEQLTRFNGEGFLFAPHWSPDAHFITFSFRKNGATNVLIYDLHTHQLKRLTETNSRNFNPIFSSDGRYIFFSSNEDGTPRIWRIGIDGRKTAEPLFTEAVTNFTPSPDGQWLYYLESRQRLTLFRANLQDGTTQEVYHSDGRPALLNSLVVTREGIYVAVTHLNDPTIQIERIDPISFQTTISWRVPGYEESLALAAQTFDVSPDGNHLLTTRVLSHNSTHFVFGNP